jgi:hypothetical protein
MTIPGAMTLAELQKLVADSKGEWEQRIGNTTSRMPQAEYQRRLLSRASARHRWENQVAEGYSGSDLDVEEIDRAVRAAIYCGRLESQSSDPFEALDRLQLRVDGHLHVAVVGSGRIERAWCRGKTVVAA